MNSEMKRRKVIILYIKNPEKYVLKKGQKRLKKHKSVEKINE